MRAIFLHSNSISWKAVKKAVKNPEEITSTEGTQKDCLTILFAVESTDDPEKIMPDFISSVEEISGKVKTDKIVLYPWVHLTSTPSPPNLTKFFF